MHKKQKTAKQILNDALRWLRNPEHWCQGTRLNDHGQTCALGAIGRAAFDDPGSLDIYTGAAYEAMHAVDVAAGFWPSVVAWNDAPNTNHEDVIAVFEKAKTLV